MSESKKAFSADTSAIRKTHVGGQALIEGIMMRGRKSWAVAIREPSGDIYTEQHDLVSGRKKNSWLLWPVIRGCTAFVESLVLGFKALNISSEHAYDWDEEDNEPKNNENVDNDSEPTKELIREHDNTKETAETDDIDSSSYEKKSSGGLGILTLISMVIGVLIGIAIFVVVPAAISNLVLGSENMNSAWWNIFDGVLRVVIFIAYIWLISLMKDIKRMFSYHGAEHKTIHCYEHGLELTPQNAQEFPTLHVRCGTAFLIMVMIIAIFIYTVLGHPINSLIDLTGITSGPLRFMLVVLTRIILMPIIAGLSYEITVKWAGSRPENPIVRIVLWPGMQMQKLTTNQPDDDMLECAIVAMKLVLERE